MWTVMTGFESSRTLSFIQLHSFYGVCLRISYFVVFHVNSRWYALPAIQTGLNFWPTIISNLECYSKPSISLEGPLSRVAQVTLSKFPWSFLKRTSWVCTYLCYRLDSRTVIHTNFTNYRTISPFSYVSVTVIFAYFIYWNADHKQLTKLRPCNNLHTLVQN